MMDKEEYFRQLYALNESSDEEVDSNDAREVLKQSAQPLSASFPVASQSPRARRSQPSNVPRKIPTFRHSTSAPVSTSAMIRETPSLPRKPSNLRYNQSSTPEILQPPSSEEAPISTATPVVQRSSSTPNPVFGPPLTFKHSTGIDSMLRKNTASNDSMLKKKTNAAAKRKRKDKLVMKSESERIFTGKTFLFIPNDDIEPFRRARIMDVRSRGGVWTQEWTPDITHVVVDKTLKLEQVMSFLKPMMKSDSLPSNVIMVNEEYPPDCVVNGILVDETQGRYAVKKMKAPEEQEPQSTKPPPTLSIQKPKSKKKDHETPEERTQRSEPSTQPLHSGVPNSSFSGRLPPTDESLVESPRERSPILDNYDGISSVLDEFIKQARDTKDLPLDDEDEEVDRPSSSERDPDQEGSSEEDHRPPTKKKKKKSKKSTGSGQKGLDQDKYSCMHAGEVIEDNLNSDTIDILTRLADYYDRVKDQWRALAYKRASGTLRTQSTKIRTYEEAIDLLFIGESIAKKIEEIVVTGRLRKLEYAELEPDDLVLQLFLKIYGVGPSEASKFIQAGHKTLEDLRTKARLTEGQEIGLEHYDDFNTRIPRDEMTALGVIVKETAKAIDPDVELIIGGSYRRGASTSGDIDFIVTKPNTDNSRDLLPFLYKLVDELTRKEFLTAALAVPGHREGSGSKWHGACVLPGNPIWRRIDFLLVPETEIGAALIYFTGDDIFNRSIRLLAGHKGYSLNQRGLYRDVLRGPGRKKLTDGELVEGSDERRIFEILGIPWRRPEHRILQ